jgi:hypothetical protein
MKGIRRNPNKLYPAVYQEPNPKTKEEKMRYRSKPDEKV